MPASKISPAVNVIKLDCRKLKLRFSLNEMLLDLNKIATKNIDSKNKLNN